MKVRKGAGMGQAAEPRLYRREMGRRRRLSLALCSILAAVACLLLAAATGDARPERRNATVTINLMANYVGLRGYQVLIDNFERAYPDIKINPTFAPTNDALYQLLRTELAGSNAPDVFVTYPGCGTPISVCVLAKAGHLAPMVNKRWAPRSVPIVTSLDKVGKGLYAFTP